jgi:hypothetical protein
VSDTSVQLCDLHWRAVPNVQSKEDYISDRSKSCDRFINSLFHPLIRGCLVQLFASGRVPLCGYCKTGTDCQTLCINAPLLQHPAQTTWPLHLLRLLRPPQAVPQVAGGRAIRCSRIRRQQGPAPKPMRTCASMRAGYQTRPTARLYVCICTRCDVYMLAERACICIASSEE